MQRWTILVLLACGAGLPMFQAGCAGPKTLSAAIAKADLGAPFAAPHVLGDESRLGLMADAAPGIDGRVTVEGHKCFRVVATRKPVEGFGYEYRSGAALMAELGDAAKAAGTELRPTDRATVELNDPSVATAAALPDPTGPCGAFEEEETKVRAVVSELVVGRLIARPSRPLDKSGSTAAGSPWSLADDGALVGKGIVAGVSLADVTVLLEAKKTYDLGESPARGTKHPLPADLGGEVEIIDVDLRAETVRFAARGVTAPLRELPPDVASCAGPDGVELGKDVRCFLWPESGHTAAAIWWEFRDSWHYDTGEKTANVVLRVALWRTDFLR